MSWTTVNIHLWGQLSVLFLCGHSCHLCCLIICSSNLQLTLALWWHWLGLLIFNYIWVRRQLMEVYNLLQCIGMFASLIHTCCWIMHNLRYQYVVQRVIKPFGRHSKPFLLKDFEQWWNEKPQFHAAFFIRMYMYCVSCKWWQMVLAIVWI